MLSSSSPLSWTLFGAAASMTYLFWKFYLSRTHDQDVEEDEVKIYQGMIRNETDSVLMNLPPTSLPMICGYDPSSVENEPISTVKASTHCVFAKSAKIWVNRSWKSNLSFEENIQSSLSSFTLFSSMREKIDGYCFQIPCDASISIQDTAKLLRNLLMFLSQQDPSQHHCMNSKYLGKRGWFFKFADSEYFITLFSPCYTKTNSRYAYGVTDHVCVLFQPYFSFLLHHVGRETPKSLTNWDHPQSSRDKTRSRFYGSNMQYFIPEKPQRVPASTVMVPWHDSSKIVQWWKEEVDIIDNPYE